MVRGTVIFHRLIIQTVDNSTSVDVDFTAGPLRYAAYMSSDSSSADFSILNGHENMTDYEKQKAFVTMFNKMRINSM